MKNQYFGDRNDLFKYDLGLEILAACNLQALVFYAMLTANDAKTDGGKPPQWYGQCRQKLQSFLQDRLLHGPRRVAEISVFLDDCGIRHLLLIDDIAEADRQSYFGSVDAEWLRSALIFVDPDNGLEVLSTRKGNLHKHVQDSEDRDLYDRMDCDSVLMICQHSPRRKRPDCFLEIGDRLRSAIRPLGCALVLPDNQVGFFRLTRSQAQRAAVTNSLAAYGVRVEASHTVPDLP